MEFAADVGRGRLYVTRHSPISNGCSLHSLDLATGVLVWEMGLQGVGPVDHSRYFNRVRPRVLANGDVVVFGREVPGRYIEVVDAASGKTNAHLFEPQPR